MDDLPENWPEEFVYTRALLYRQQQPYAVAKFLSNHKRTVVARLPPMVEKGLIHPLISLRKITPHLHFVGKKPHPLSRRLYDKRAHYGLFAKKTIDSGLLLGEYVGEVTLKPNGATRHWKDFDHGAALLHEGALLCINAKKYANELAFLNDYRGIAQKPNVVARWIFHQGQPHLLYETVLPIRKDMELLMDYGEPYWQGAERKRQLSSISQS